MDTNLRIVNDERYRQAELLLTRRAATSAERLHSRLVLVEQRHGLTWKRLIKMQRAIQAASDSEAGQPSIWSYWDESANPESTPLFEGASTAITQELALVADAVGRFINTARQLGLDDEHVLGESIRDAFKGLEQSGLCADELNRIGQRWQRRLHRAAVRRASMSLLITDTSQAELRVIQAEMELLETAPWAHMDRMLMAFEFAHSDIRCHLRDQISQVIFNSLECSSGATIPTLRAVSVTAEHR